MKFAFTVEKTAVQKATVKAVKAEQSFRSEYLSDCLLSDSKRLRIPSITIFKTPTLRYTCYNSCTYEYVILMHLTFSGVFDLLKWCKEAPDIIKHRS